MDFVRTLDERFAALPDYDFAPHYTEVDGLRNVGPELAALVNDFIARTS